MKQINISKQSPEIYQSVIKLDQNIEQQVENSCFDTKFIHLLRLRASQINQCAFCVRFHSNDALKYGESIERLTLVSAWRESDYFTEQERAALGLTEAITLIHDHQQLRLAHEKSTKALSDNDVNFVEWLAITTNSLNRIAISSRYGVSPNH